MCIAPLGFSLLPGLSPALGFKLLDPEFKGEGPLSEAQFFFLRQTMLFLLQNGVLVRVLVQTDVSWDFSEEELWFTRGI
jgi:hypothetical protein